MKRFLQANLACNYLIYISRTTWVVFEMEIEKRKGKREDALEVRIEW